MIECLVPVNKARENYSRGSSITKQHAPLTTHDSPLTTHYDTDKKLVR